LWPLWVTEMTEQSTPLHDVKFPNEGTAYRDARNELLIAERELRRQVERVAALRRTLPPGGTIPEDYVFDEAPHDQARRRVRFSAVRR